MTQISHPALKSCSDSQAAYLKITSVGKASINIRQSLNLPVMRVHNTTTIPSPNPEVVIRDLGEWLLC